MTSRLFRREGGAEVGRCSEDMPEALAPAWHFYDVDHHVVWDDPPRQSDEALVGTRHAHAGRRTYMGRTDDQSTARLGDDP